MAGGGLMQLVAYGAQDIYLTGNPQITFFKVVYRRHTNFAMESMEQTFTGNADFGRKVSCLVARNGDLIHKAYLQIDLPPLTANATKTVAWTRNIGHVILDEVSVEIVNIQGKMIRKLAARHLEAGTNTIELHADGLAAGLYIALIIKNGNVTDHIRFSVVE